MEDVHRRAIQSNFVSLVEQTDLDLMVSALYEKGVFTERMIEKYKDNRIDVRDRKRQLYISVMLRGPDAFRHLTDALQEAGYWNLARDLDPNSFLHTSRSHPGPRPNSREENSFISIRMKDRKTELEPQKSCVLDEAAMPGLMPALSSKEGKENIETEDDNIPHFNVIKSTKFIDESETGFKLYRTRGRRGQRGVLLAFSYICFLNEMEKHRRGADVDAKNLKYLFSELGFEVCSYINLTKEKTKETLSLLNQVLAGVECVFIVVSSHGHSRDNASDVDFRCHDGRLMSIYEFLEYFNNDRLPALKGIPKVFIFQLCRGLMKQPMPPGAPAVTYSDGITHVGAADLAPAPTHAPALPPPAPARLYSDILIAHSTLPGYVSHRDVYNGSWYIQVLCSVFAAHAHYKHVEDLFTLVDVELEKIYQVQTSSVERWGFNKRLYLHPGLYET